MKESKAPQFVIDMMERLKKQPPPTPDKVKTQMESSMRVRAELMEGKETSSGPN